MKAVAPVAVLAVVAVITVVMFAARGAVERVRPEVVPPLVQVMTAEPAPAALTVLAQGTVTPRTESDLVAEVAGRVIWVSPELASGGFFTEGDVLARVDPRDYEMNLEAARASLARSESEWNHARSSLVRQRSMRSKGASSKSRLDDAIHAEAVAEAGLREARVAVARATLELARTEIRVPFAGRIQEKYVDVGQFIARGSPVARVYAVDYAEVRLPLSDGDAAFLDLPLGYRPEAEPEDGGGVSAQASGPEVEFSARLAGQRHVWQGRVVRTEGTLDPRTRMITAVARIDDPYGREQNSGRPPLPMGLFVEAAIQGRVIPEVFELSRSALRDRDDSLLLVDDESRLRLRRVEVLRADRDRVWVKSGLEPGDRVVTTRLDLFVEGMVVRTAEHTAGQGAGS